MARANVVQWVNVFTNARRTQSNGKLETWQYTNDEFRVRIKVHDETIHVSQQGSFERVEAACTLRSLTVTPYHDGD